MSGYFDLLLPRPIGDGWLHGLLFASFMLHFAFVLFTIGTAVIALTYFVRARFGGDETVEGWDRQILSSFFVHKSLAIVLGVGPILLMQVGNTIPFVTAGSLLAPLWMGLVVFLLVSLALLESLAGRRVPGRWGYLAVGVVGLAALLAVPGTFVAVVSTSERPATWRPMFTLGGMPSALAVHWLLRFLHVLGAAVVFTAALHLVGGRSPEKRASFGRWVMGGLAVQIPLGVALLLTLPRDLGRAALAALLVGVASAVLAAWMFYRAAQRDSGVGVTGLSAVLLTLLLAMLLTRQFVQDRVLVPLDRQLRASAEAYRATLAPDPGAVLASYRTVSEVPYDNPLTIYARSCHICHGAVGNGQGYEAANLMVQPEDLTGVRAGDAELRRILREGIPGTAMPRFDFYTDDRLGELVGFLRGSVGLASAPEPLPVEPTPASRAAAARVFAGTCATCHGADGRGTELSRAFGPPPPDLTRYTLSPGRALDVLTRGYPGTMMPSFADLPLDTRWALVERVRSLYHPR